MSSCITFVEDKERNDAESKGRNPNDRDLALGEACKSSEAEGKGRNPNDRDPCIR